MKVVISQKSISNSFIEKLHGHSFIGHWKTYFERMNLNRQKKFQGGQQLLNEPYESQEENAKDRSLEEDLGADNKNLVD